MRISSIEHFNRAPAAPLFPHRTTQSKRRVKQRKEREKKRSPRPKECCGGSSIIINTFKRMSFCAQFIIIPKRAHLYRTPDARSFSPFVIFRYSSRRQKGPRVGMIFAIADASRVFIYHCSTLCAKLVVVYRLSLVRFTPFHPPLPHCLFQFTPKPLPSPWNTHREKVFPPPNDCSATSKWWSNYGRLRRSAVPLLAQNIASVSLCEIKSKKFVQFSCAQINVGPGEKKEVCMPQLWHFFGTCAYSHRPNSSDRDRLFVCLCQTIKYQMAFIYTCTKIQVNTEYNTRNGRTRHRNKKIKK